MAGDDVERRLVDGATRDYTDTSVRRLRDDVHDTLKEHYVSTAGLKDALEPLSADIASIKGGISVVKVIVMVVAPLVAALAGAGITAAALLLAGTVLD